MGLKNSIKNCYSELSYFELEVTKIKKFSGYNFNQCELIFYQTFKKISEMIVIRPGT